MAFAQFDLWGSNGYRISITGSPKGVRLIASRRHEAVLYLDREGVADHDSINALFGHLGRIAVRFHPTKKLLHDKEQCDFFGNPIYHGYFTGTFSFRGEGRYTSARRRKIHGLAGGPLAVKCASRREAISTAADSAKASLGPKLETSLVKARRTFGGRRFVAGGDAITSVLPLVKSGLPLKLSGLPRKGVPYRVEVYEDRVRLAIIRVLVAKGPADGFSIRADGKEATVRPPKPFSGEAEFRACAIPFEWRGTLKVSLPGLPNLALAGKEFFTQLKPQKKCTASDVAAVDAKSAVSTLP
jgi:hypothetical protein